jgi:predicted transcriptional regulator
MKFEQPPKMTYYKFQVTHNETKEIKLYKRYKELFEDYKIPRSTLYKMMDGKHFNKHKDYTFKQVRIPKFEIRPSA